MDKLRFLHIPKTAGSTFKKILVHQYRGKGHFKFTGENPVDIRRFRELSKEDQKAVDLFTGHAPLFTGLPEADEIPIITILRDPVERVKSFCQHVSEGKSPYLQKQFPPESFSLNEFLYSKNKEISNLQTRMLVDYEKYREKASIKSISPIAMKERALDNLFNRITCYGIQEYFDESMILFTSRLGWHMPFYEYRNRKNMKRLLNFEDHHIEKIQELNSIDIEVYEIAKRRFISTIESEYYDKNKLIVFKRMQKYVSPMLHFYGVVGRATVRLFKHRPE